MSHSMSILDILDTAESTENLSTVDSNLNPDAKCFVPSSASQPPIPATQSPMQSAIDDTPFTQQYNMGYQSPVQSAIDDTPFAQQYNLGYHQPHLQYPSSSVDAYTGFWLDREDVLRQQLYMPAQRPKGNTYGRKGREGNWPRA